ncbi:helix-turn-helix domain-containing protein [Actinomadura violacea]|uniref:Helix-turn-helix transcriptional regulator n=1 Tax=Actinomadura violacea TaxID=2819934 RepID=A0ABS3RRL5_9ACTN|nr:helix-turn-helix transcriptional regulator [Actinomadura violacea]MBO2459358.1 helix-turn-helix transcriptional regulator [Actinomadura violacea]
MVEQNEVIDDQFIAYKVRYRLSQQKVTQVALAKELGVSEFYVSRRVRGEVPFSAVELGKVAVFLRVEIAYFFPPILSERAS